MRTRLISILLIVLMSCEYHDVSPTSGRCLLEPDAGLCEAAIPKYYYDKTEGTCKMFVWGGCGGVVPFNSMEECRACESGR